MNAEGEECIRYAAIVLTLASCGKNRAEGAEADGSKMVGLAIFKII